MDALRRSCAVAAAAGLLAACGAGDYRGSAPPADGSGTVPQGDADCTTLFASRVQPRLDFCRNCHVPGGIADVPDGHLFQLSPVRADDYANLRVSWERLGRNDAGTSRILKMASGTDSRSHSGGTPWPQGSAGYMDVGKLLLGFADPGQCVGAGGGGVVPTEAPLLGPARGGSKASNFCAGRPDAALLPPDPRTLIVRGVNDGKAVGFNAVWHACDNGVPRPATCGELRAQQALGYIVAEGQGAVGSPTSFAGGQDNPDGLAAEKYNKLWSAWGLAARPDNFDELVAQRYGSPHSVGRNPYPLPGEDPNAADGGSGQLPLVFTQIRTPDGAWTGKIGTKVCVFCHNGELGTPADGPGLGVQLGGAGSIGDFTVAGYDFGKAAGFPPAASSATDAITISTNRGTGAIDFFQLAFILFSRGDPQLLLNDKIVLSQAIGNIKSPPWWNLAYRPQKFHGAILPTDSSRIDLAAYYDLGKALSGGNPMPWVDAHAGPFQTWAESQPSPRYPGPVDTALAEQGAILFHGKNLWEPALRNPVPRPEKGNGSCAGCHGAYSPRYVSDPAYLDDPALAGIAAYALPMSVVGTDPVYADAMQSLKNRDGSVSPAIMNNDLLYCGLGEAGSTDLTPLMLAPPLWGVWAAAPYFHNGSVPNVWGVLDPAHERPRIWRRVSAPARGDQQGQVVMGFDTSLQRAYDAQKLGWKYDELPCGAAGAQPYIACDPANPDGPSPVQALLSIIYTDVGFTWNLPRPEGLTMTQQDIENRKVFNTHLYSQGNGGHAFTSVLTDAERRALIEYLKTL